MHGASDSQIHQQSLGFLESLCNERYEVFYEF